MTQERLVTRTEAHVDVNRAGGATMVVPPAISRRPLYVGTSVLIGLIAVVGFWPTYFGPLMRGTLAQPLLIHVHTAVFVGGLFLFLLTLIILGIVKFSEVQSTEPQDIQVASHEGHNMVRMGLGWVPAT